ncbi:hypothetical protein D3C80_1623520 [compost metagenome]
MGQVLGRDLVHGKLAAIDAPLHVIGPHHLAGLVGVRLVVLLERRIERRQVAAVGIGDHQLLLVGEGAAVGVAQGDLHLIAAPLGHLEVGGACGGSRA